MPSRNYNLMVHRGIVRNIFFLAERLFQASFHHVSGTNNARLSAMLRQLAAYHAKDPNNLFCVRLAQGLTHLGKGTLTLCPYHCDRQIMHPVAVAGLLSFLVACLDCKTGE